MSSSDENLDIPQESEVTKEVTKEEIKEEIKNEIIKLPEINNEDTEVKKPEPKKRAGRKSTLSTLKKEVVPKEKLDKKIPSKEEILEKKNKIIILFER